MLSLVHASGLWALLLLSGAVEANQHETTIRSVLQEYALKEHNEWNCSIALAVFSPSLSTDNPLVAAAAGFTNQGLEFSAHDLRPAQPEDMYVWGSITKMFTGPAVLQLVERGTVALDDKITKHVDPYLRRSGQPTLGQHFNIDANITNVTIRHLLHMESGLPDYDRGNYSVDQFAAPGHDFSPEEILHKYVPREFDFSPGTHQDYCSTNYILLGMVLATHMTNGTWKDYNQATVFPEHLRESFSRSVFVDKGRCSDHTTVHGIMGPSDYDPSATSDTDISNVSCVGGWTAGNYVGAVTDVAKYTYELYNARQPGIVSKASQALMIDFSAPGSGHHHFKFYGIGTFSLDWSVSTARENVTAYGHVGDTYGYQSQTTYFPGLDLALTVATNIESSSQAQPAEATCRIYHALVAALSGKPDPGCSFVVPHYFIGTCSCP